MRLWARVRWEVRAALRPSRQSRELDEELGFALRELTARHRERGLSTEAAARAARLELGQAEVIKESIRDRSLGHGLETLRRDIASACRRLVKTPLFSTLVIAVLAGGIGAASTMFSVVNAMLLTPFPYPDADRLVFVWQDLTSAGYPRAPLAGPELQDLRARSDRFESIGGIWANTAALTDDGRPEQLRIGLVTANFFDVLGVQASLGRTFVPGDTDPRALRTIVLSWPLWQRRYQGRSDVIGRTVAVNGTRTRIIGVMPEPFRPLLPADAAIPHDQDAWQVLGGDGLLGPRQQQFLRVVARMKPGVAFADARDEVEAIGNAVATETTEYGRDGLHLSAALLQADAVREARPSVLWLFVAVGLLLTIACVNAAGLLISRAAERHHETAIRLAIGGSRARVFREGFIEGALLSLAGGLGGVMLARVLLGTLLAVRPTSLARIDGTTVDAVVVLFAAIVSLAVGVLFSLAPLAQILRTRVAGVLQSPAFARDRPSRVRMTLVIVQVAISSLLLVTAGLLAKGFQQLHDAPLGFIDGGVVTFKVSLPSNRYRDLASITRFSQELRTQLGRLPGVRRAGATSHLPHDPLPNWGTPYVLEGRPLTETAGVADARAVTPGYFETLGAELVEGRWFSDVDRSGSEAVAIVDTMLAQRLWPGSAAVGRRLQADPGTTGIPRVLVTIVGVVRHMRHRDLTRDLREQMYFPAAQSYRNPMTYVMHASAPLPDLVPHVRAAVAAIDPALPAYELRTFGSYTDAARAVRRFTLLLNAAFAVAALMLAAVGVYGVTRYAVICREREFGLRLALGARSPDVALMVLREGVALGACGAAIGCLGAAVAAYSIRLQLYNVSPADPAPYVAAAAAVMISALIASSVPASRAARATPAELLRPAS